MAQTDELVALMQRITEHSRAGRFADAIPVARRLVAETDKRAGPDHPLAAMTLFTLAELLRMQGDLDEADPLLKRVLDIREKTLGAEHPDVATTLASLSFLAVTRAKYDEAERYVERALAIRTKALGSDHPDSAMMLITLGRVRYYQARYQDAEQLIQRALQAFEAAQGPEHVNVAVGLNNLAQVYKEQGRLAMAEEPLRRALAIQEKTFGSDSLFIAAMLNNLGELYRGMGRYAEAEALFRREQQISEKALGPDHPEVAKSLSNLATLFASMGRTSDALSLMRRALAINEKAYGEQHPDVATTINNLASAVAGERPREAEALFRRSLAIREKILGADNPSVAIPLDNLATLFHQERRYAEAEPLARRSLAIREKAFGGEHLQTAASLNNLASVLDNLKRHDEARPLLERAVAIRAAALGDLHPDLATSLHNLASHHLDTDDWAAAYQAFKRSVAIWLARSSAGADVTQEGESEIQKHADPFLGLIVAAHHLAESGDSEMGKRLSAETFDTAQRVVELGAARAIFGMSARAAAGNGSLRDLVRLRQDLAQEAAAMDRALIAAVSQPAQDRRTAAEATMRERLSQIAAKLKDTDIALGRSFPDYAALSSAAPVSLAEVSRLLNGDEALVLFAPTAKATFVWAVTSTDSRWVRAPITSQDLAARVSALRCGLDLAGEWQGDAATKCNELLGSMPAPDTATALPFDLSRAHDLYAALFGPVESLIKGKQILIVPSGPLTKLPFHVLVTEAPATAVPHDPGAYSKAAWLAQRAAITVLPSVASLKALRAFAKQSRATEAFIGFGNPLLTGASGSDKSAWAKQSCPPGPTLAKLVSTAQVRPQTKLLRGGVADIEELRRQVPLPETADELCSVAQLLGTPGEAVYLGQRATERNVKALSTAGKLSRARVVHFATHGLLAAETEALTRTRSEPALVLTPPVKASEEDDGLLTASEVAQLKLDADWVVLSACNTAAGANDLADSEMLSGLARAFFYAGARTLLVSHWAVDSEATVELITRAFDAMKVDQKAGRAEALRRSMAALIDRGGRYAHPAVWAPFVVVGEGAR